MGLIETILGGMDSRGGSFTGSVSGLGGQFGGGSRGDYSLELTPGSIGVPGAGIKPATGASAGEARPAGCPDYEMVCTGMSAQQAAQTAQTVLTGNPNSYTYATTYVTSDRGRGRPFVGIGCTTSLTRPNAGQLIGSMSYGGDPAASFPSFVTDPLEALMHSNGRLRVPMQEGETFQLTMDNNNVSEQNQAFYVINYGSPGHPWPADIEELIHLSGLGQKIREIWMPRIGLTASLTTDVATVTMNAAGTTDDRWIDGESEYYVLGAMTQSVAAASGVLGFQQGLPSWQRMRNNRIPYGNSFYAASGAGKGVIVPAYWPIGPFTSANPIQIGATGTAAAAQVVRIVIGKC